MMPAILPVNEEVRSDEDDFKSIGRMVVMAETTLSFFWVPKATTCTSSRFSAVGLSCRFIVVLPLMGITSSLYPTNENTSTSSGS